MLQCLAAPGRLPSQLHPAAKERLAPVLQTLFRKLRRPPFAAPAPEEPLCVIGDVHGCFQLLEQLLAQVPEGYRIILAGDYADRGPQSAAVLRYLAKRDDVTCLKGNHEDMLLRFLRDPGREGGRWIHNGGLETLYSFGISGSHLQMQAEELCDCRDRLQEAMGQSLADWIAGLPTSVLSGNVLVAHAGADPGMAPQQQPEPVLLWGHKSFLRVPRRDGVWVVHGHTIVGTPAAGRGRIAIDTGAFATGRLSAVCLDGGAPQFITVQQ